MAIDSALTQTFGDFEIIVLDDCSQDETSRLAVEYRDRGNIRFVRNEKNIGFVLNWNKGLDLAQGEYIKIMGDDDILDKNCLAEQVKVLDEYDDVGIACSNYLAIDADNNTLTSQDENPYRLFVGDRKESGEDLIKNYLLQKRRIGWPTAILFRRRDIDKVGYFDPAVGCAADIDMWSRILASTNFYYLDKVLAFNRQGEENLSKKLLGSQFGYRAEMVYYFKTMAHMKDKLGAPARHVGKMMMLDKIRCYYLRADEKNKNLIMNDYSASLLAKEGDSGGANGPAKPDISILLPVYNGADLLTRAIESLLMQTFTDFELIILNDGSTDASEEIISNYSDNRIVAIAHENMGLARTLNRGLDIARGAYICRLDQDDVADRGRLAQQKAYLDNHADVGLVGSTSWLATLDGEIKRIASYAFSDEDIRWFLLFDNPMIHSSVMFRSSLLKAHGAYDQSKTYDYTQDYDLWSRMAGYTKLVNLETPLVTRVEHPEGMTLSNLEEQRRQAFDISARNCRFSVGDNLPLDDDDIAFLRSAWLGMDLPEHLSITAALKRISVLLKAGRKLFQGAYADYPPETKQLIKRRLSDKYLNKMWAGPAPSSFVRWALAMSLEPKRLMNIRLYWQIGKHTGERLLRHVWQISKKLLLRPQSDS